MFEKDLKLLELESQNKVVNKLFIQPRDDTTILSDLFGLYF